MLENLILQIFSYVFCIMLLKTAFLPSSWDSEGGENHAETREKYRKFNTPNVHKRPLGFIFLRK